MAFGLILLGGAGFWSPAEAKDLYRVAEFISRIDLEGQSSTPVIPLIGETRDVALDPVAGKVYWTDTWPAGINRVNLDGSAPEQVLPEASPNGIAVDAVDGKVYWNQFGTIMRANLDGTGVETLVTGLGGSSPGIALDPAGGKMYWTDSNGAIGRANLDGSGVETLVTGLSGPRRIALDPAGGKMYWTELGSGLLQRANFDGSEIETLVTGLRNATNGGGIALDLVAGKVYWGDLVSSFPVDNYYIHRANLDGSDRERFLFVGNFAFGGAIGMAIDAQDGKLYWTDGPHTSAPPPKAERRSHIQRINLDGTGVETILDARNRRFQGATVDPVAGKIYWTETTTGIAGIRRANLDGDREELLVAGIYQDIAVDSAGGKMYWADQDANRISRANLDGSGIETLVTGITPSKLALDRLSGKLYWVDVNTITIQRANLDGTGVETVVSGEAIAGIAVDSSGRKLYWIQFSSADHSWRLQRAGVDGSNVEVLVTGIFGGAAIALDIAAGKMYWDQWDTDGFNFWYWIARANLDGSDQEVVLSTSEGTGDIALDVSAIYDVWVSSSIDDSPFTPSHDCVSVYETTITSDRCGDMGPLLRYPVPQLPGFGFLVGYLPCGGYHLILSGTSYDPSPATTVGDRLISASILGASHAFSLGLEGLEDAACSVAFGEASPNPFDRLTPVASPLDEQIRIELGRGDFGALGPESTFTAQSVANRTYQVWFSQATDGPPFQPVADCVRFTADTMAVDSCTAEGPLVELPQFGLWMASVSCGSEELFFLGNSLDTGALPLGGNVMSAVVVGLPGEGTKMAVEGFENPACGSPATDPDR